MLLISIVICLNPICAAADENLTIQNIINSGPGPYNTDILPVYPFPSVGNGFIMGYYINPKVTPISEIDFKALKDAGITDIYVLVDDDNYKEILSDAKAKAGNVGIRTNAWVYPGFSYASQVAQMQMGVLLDVETYDMPAYLSLIKQMRSETQGVTFSLCVKPDGWDDNQYYYQIAPFCDHIVPMLYIGDYGQGVTGLSDWAKNYNVYNIVYPGKIIAGLETYQSDQDLTPKNASTMMSEIKAVQQYTKGVILFRYGLSNFTGLN